jgi:S-ribosylhomocysteine lyase LuxS involved in autoinducer biosynthesis
VIVKDVFLAVKEEIGIKNAEISEMTGIAYQSVGKLIVARESISMNKYLFVLEKMGAEFWFRNEKRKIALIRSDLEPVNVDDGFEVIRFNKDDKNQVWQIWKTMLEIEGLRKTQYEAAVGYSPQALEYKIMRRGTIKASEFFEISAPFGYLPKFYMLESGKPIEKDMHEEKREQVKGMSDLVRYNTNDATFLATSFYADGVHKYDEDGIAQDLYVDKEGRYFFAEFSSDPKEKSRVRSVTSSVAKAFIKQFGK